jgi:hypothetical protein
MHIARKTVIITDKNHQSKRKEVVYKTLNVMLNLLKSASITILVQKGFAPPEILQNDKRS